MTYKAPFGGKAKFPGPSIGSKDSYYRDRQAEIEEAWMFNEPLPPIGNRWRSRPKKTPKSAAEARARKRRTL